MDTEVANVLTQVEWLAERAALQQRVAELEAQVQQAQASIGKQLHFTEALLAAIPTPVFFKDAEGRYLGCNDAFTDQMGVSAEEIHGKTVYELWPSEHATVYHQKDLELLQNPERQVYDFKVQDKNGQERDVIFAKNVFCDEAGQVAGLVGAYVDITTQKQIEKKLRASQERLRLSENRLDLAMAVKNEGIWDWNLVTNETFFDDRYYTMAGYAPNEFPQNFTAWAERVHPDDLERASDAIKAYLDGQSNVFDTEFRFRHKDGSWIWIQGRGKIVERDAKGSPLRMIGTHTDITERKRAEEALRASEQRYRSLIEHSNDAIYLLYDGRFELINSRFAALFGITPEEVCAPDFDFMSLVAPASRSLIEQRTRQLQARQATPSRYEFTALTRAGQEIEVEVSVSYIAYRDGLATQGILRDISARKRAEREQQHLLERVQRQQKTVVALSLHPAFSAGDVTAAARFLTETVAKTLDVARASVWLVENEATELRCHDLYLYDEDAHQSGHILTATDFPAYFAALTQERTIDAHDAHTDPRTNEFSATYLAPNSIASMLDATIRFSGTMVGVVCFEHIGAPRIWHADEITVAGAVADQMSQVLANAARKQAEEALVRSELMFRQSINMLPMGCVITDSQGNVNYINQMFTQMLGFTIEDIPHANDWFNRAYPDPTYRERVIEAWNTDLARLNDPEENLAPHIFAVTTKDGRTRTVEFRQSFIGSRLLILFNDITERQRIENALRKSEHRFRELIELAVDGILLGSPEGVITGANSRMLTLLGIEAEALLGKHVREIFTPHSLQENPLRFDLLARGETVIHERVIQRTDGTHVYVEMHSKQMPDGSYQSIVHDITERKQAEEALRESQAMLNLILDTVPQAIFWKDREGRYLGCNKTFAAAVGLEDPAHIVGQTDFELPWTREEAEAYRADDREVLEHNRPKRHIIEPLRQADGTRLWIDTSKVPLVDEHGHPFAVLGVYEDVTERKQTEQKLAASQRMLNDVINTIPVRVFWKDLEGRFLGCNRLFAQDAGRPDPESLLGDNDFSMGWAEQAELYRADDRAVIEYDEPKINYEEPQTTPDGQQRWLRTSKIPLRDGEGRVYGILGVYEDITQRKALETQLRRQEQLAAIGQLAAGIAHDFRNLLTTIILYAQLGQRRPDTPPAVTPYLTTIIGEARKATELVQQILDFARRAEIERCPLDLVPFVGKVVSVLQRTLPENIHIVLDVGAIDCVIAGDAGRLQQALMNLALNARDAMPEGGTLHIGLTRTTVAPGTQLPMPAITQATAPQAWIYLSVADTGTGMSEEAYAHRFEPFFTTKEPEQGTGLGLAQVYGIIQLHHGHIDVTTEQGKGTTFHIYLPAATTTAEEMELTVAPIPLGHGETLLLVEDNAQLREAGRNLLTDLGYRVLTAANGQEALALYQQESDTDLLITDLVMPEMGGKALLEALYYVAPHLKALVMTGYTAEESETELRAAGFLEVIRKPLDAEHLAQAIRRALEAQ